VLAQLDHHGRRGPTVARLIYSTIESLDGYVADEHGNFDWAAPDEEVHRFVNEVERPIGTYLYGRRMYDVMAYWETAPGGQATATGDFAEIWRAADKVVYSATREEPSTAKTQIERSFDPDAVRRLKARSKRDLSVGGPALAAHAIRAGLVDEYHLFITPVVVGGGTRSLPDGCQMELDLLAERRFQSGVVHLHYAARRPAPRAHQRQLPG
jgi:dihydrofolate reductase